MLHQPNKPELGEESSQGRCTILSRYALILDTVARALGGLTLAEIGQRTALPQATVYRLVHALVQVGFLAPGERRKQYVLGSRLRRLLCVGIPLRKIRQVAQPILDRLAADFGETAFIAKLEGDEVETVAVAPAAGGRQAFVHPGRSMPFHAAASAKAIIAFADERLLGELLAKAPEQFTPRTKTSRQDITAELARVREQGFAVCDQEFDPGALSYACPIRLGGVGVVYSLGLVGCAARLGGPPSTEIVSSLKTAAETLSGVMRDEEPHATSLAPA